mgnify:CR=1 FL=1
MLLLFIMLTKKSTDRTAVQKVILYSIEINYILKYKLFDLKRMRYVNNFLSKAFKPIKAKLSCA